MLGSKKKNEIWQLGFYCDVTTYHFPIEVVVFVDILERAETGIESTMAVTRVAGFELDLFNCLTIFNAIVPKSWTVLQLKISSFLNVKWYSFLEHSA